MEARARDVTRRRKGVGGKGGGNHERGVAGKLVRKLAHRAANGRKTTGAHRRKKITREKKKKKEKKKIN